MASSSHKKRRSWERSSTDIGILEKWFVGYEEEIASFMHEMSRKQINIPKVLEFSWMKEKKLEEPRELLKFQRLKPLLEIIGNVYPNLIKVFYTNVSLEGKNMISSVKGVTMLITSEVWSNTAGLKHFGVKVGRGNVAEISEFNKMQFYRSCLKDSKLNS